jgi:hypothetical protein
MLHPFVALENHDQIHAFDADLQSPVAASDGKERRRTPSVFCTASCYALAILAAKHEAGLAPMGKDGHALCAFEHIWRYAFDLAPAKRIP